LGVGGRKRAPPIAVGGLKVINKKVGSWGKKRVREKVKAHGLRSMGLLFLNDVRQKKTPPTSMRWMGNDYLKVA
jgi:hypothetical protein